MKNIDALVEEIAQDAFNAKCNFQLDQNVNELEGIQHTLPIRISLGLMLIIHTNLFNASRFNTVLAIPHKASVV